MNSLTDPKRKITKYLMDHPTLISDAQRRGYYLPISAEIDLTWRCALNCKGCHSKWMHQGIELNYEQVEHILGELTRVGVKSVTWSGGGEPLESPIWDVAMMAADELGLDQAVYTYFPSPTQQKVDFLDAIVRFVYSHTFNTKGLKREGRKCIWTAGFLLDTDNWNKARNYLDSTDQDFFDYVDFRPLCPINHPEAKLLDYSWVGECMYMLQEMADKNPKVRWADYKFADLLQPDFGRTYSECHSTDFIAVVGPNGDMYQCINRRNVTVIGNIFKESIEDIYARKAHVWDDFKGCRILCRNHEMNKELIQLVGPPILHGSFV